MKKAGIRDPKGVISRHVTLLWPLKKNFSAFAPPRICTRKSPFTPYRRPWHDLHRFRTVCLQDFIDNRSAWAIRSFRGCQAALA